jgi:hypothetical protein
LEEYNKNNQFVFAENLLKNIKLIDKLKALIKSFYLPINKNLNKNDIAVILFTS